MNALKIIIPENYRHTPPLVSLIGLNPIEEEFFLFKNRKPILVDSTVFIPTTASRVVQAYNDFEVGELVLMVEDKVVKMATNSDGVGICCSLISIIKETPTMLKATVISSIGSVPHFVGDELNMKKNRSNLRNFYKFS